MSQRHKKELRVKILYNVLVLCVQQSPINEHKMDPWVLKILADVYCFDGKTRAPDCGYSPSFVVLDEGVDRNDLTNAKV